MALGLGIALHDLNDPSIHVEAALCRRRFDVDRPPRRWIVDRASLEILFAWILPRQDSSISILLLRLVFFKL